MRPRRSDWRPTIPKTSLASFAALLGLSLATHGCSPPEASPPQREASEPVRSPLAINPALISLAHAAPRSLDAAERENVVGAAIYRATCALCHGPGIAGAPRLDHGDSWRQRAATGTETLIGHAISGYRGDRGLMPARGGNPSLSDDEVRAAVEYMLSRALAGSGPTDSAAN